MEQTTKELSRLNFSNSLPVLESSMGAREMTQHVRVLVAFLEVPGSSLSTHEEAYNHQ